MRVGISLLTLVPGVSGGSETYVRSLVRALARVGSNEYRVFLPSGTTINALSYIRWQDKDYSVVGEPARIDGFSAENHVEAIMQLVEGA